MQKWGRGCNIYEKKREEARLGRRTHQNIRTILQFLLARYRIPMLDGTDETLLLASCSVIGRTCTTNSVISTRKLRQILRNLTARGCQETTLLTAGQGGHSSRGTWATYLCVCLTSLCISLCLFAAGWNENQLFLVAIYYLHANLLQLSCLWARTAKKKKKKKRHSKNSSLG